MLPGPGRTFFSQNVRAIWLAAIFVIFLPPGVNAEPRSGNVVCRAELSAKHRQQLTSKLRKITGFTDLRFDQNGFLRAGGFSGLGSASARALINDALYGRNVIVVEDASDQQSVGFAQVVPGKWKKNGHIGPVFVIQIDFADFEQLVGDARAREAFDVGWGFLHELDHIVSDSPDATTLGETGECEAHLNQMRRECNLPERTDYFSVLSPLATDSSFMTRFVRLSFEAHEPATNKTRRYWLTWDANAVGGVEVGPIAAMR